MLAWMVVQIIEPIGKLELLQTCVSVCERVCVCVCVCVCVVTHVNI